MVRIMENNAVEYTILQNVNNNSISLTYGGITSLPPEIALLARVKHLYLSVNELTTLPEEIGCLTTLKILYLDRNKLTNLCPEIGLLTNLIELYLNENELTTLPPEIGLLKNLRVLSILGNKLETLPPEIGDLSNLNTLYLSGNRLKTLPKEIANLKNLERLNLFDNPIPLPPEILAKIDEPKAIITYYLSHYIDPGEKRPLNEAKVLIVGQGAVGKTSLVNRLLYKDYEGKETLTEGIDIHRWQLVVNKEEIHLNIWDFGGQEILHATHQFFLTRRSLYLLVLDSRLDEQANRVEYWLKLIQAFGGGSPIIIICNKCDEYPMEMNWRGLKEKYSNIRGFVKRVSCLSGEGIDDLRNLIAIEVGELQHVGDALLTSWFAVKDELATMSRKKIDYLPYGEYERICQNHQITEESHRRILIDYLHDLGIALNFSEHPLFVLNPEWVTLGVYQILNSNTLFHTKGVLTRSNLNEILDIQRYPPDKHLFIIDLMRRFELLFDFEGLFNERFLIPDLLAKEEPDTGKWEDCLRFQYNYDVLPTSIISRFMVRMHSHISLHTYWRTGVVLIWGEGPNRALVKADIEDARISISVNGNLQTRRNCLTAIRTCFREIHQSIPGLSIQEKIPIAKYSGIVVDYPHLLNLEKIGEEKYYPEGISPPIAVNVKEVLEGIEAKEGLSSLKSKADNLFQQIIIGDNVMRDKYDIKGQAGAIGPRASAQHMLFQQIWQEIGGNINLSVLADELEKLRQNLTKEAGEPEHYETLANLAKAEKEARDGDGIKSLAWLKKAGGWALKKADEIGTNVAVEVLKKVMGY